MRWWLVIKKIEFPYISSVLHGCSLVLSLPHKYKIFFDNNKIVLIKKQNQWVFFYENSCFCSIREETVEEKYLNWNINNLQKMFLMRLGSPKNAQTFLFTLKAFSSRNYIEIILQYNWSELIQLFYKIINEFNAFLSLENKVFQAFHK